MWYNRDNRRAFFEEYAKENNFDPLHNEKWYSQPRKKILEKKVKHDTFLNLNFNDKTYILECSSSIKIPQHECSRGINGPIP